MFRLGYLIEGGVNFGLSYLSVIYLKPLEVNFMFGLNLNFVS